MLRRLNARNLLVAAFAGGGALAAHWLGYRSVSHGSHSHEQDLLAATGHEYFTYVIAGVLALTAFLLWRYVSHRFGDRRAPGVHGFQLFAQAAVRLIPFQGLAFIALELTERALFAGGLTNVFTEPAVLMGLFFQVVCGIVGAILLAAFAGVVEAFRRRSTSAAARRPVTRVYPKAVYRTRRLTLAESGLGLRSPPSLSN